MKLSQQIGSKFPFGKRAASDAKKTAKDEKQARKLARAQARADALSHAAALDNQRPQGGSGPNGV